MKVTKSEFLMGRRTVVENLDLAGHYKVFHQKFRKSGFFTHVLRK